MHYYRVRRSKIDSPKVKPLTYVIATKEGYTLIKVPGHPLAMANGWAFEHRVVAYTKYGEGPHPCHWCGTSLAWRHITVDHLNNRKSDNDPANVVVACMLCNRIRGAMIPFIKRMKANRIADLIGTFGHMRSAPAQPK